ncbi:unnamed protein product [Caenorhabditis brenneri]
MESHKYTLTELRKLQDDDELDLSARAIKDFPNGIVQLTRLTKLDLNHNSLTVLPDLFCKMTRLIRLDLGKNKLHHLPNDIGNLTNLQHLTLFDNQIEDLPLSFAKLKSLKYLDLKKNPLNPRLLALAGACNTTAECEKAAKQVVDVYIGEQLKKLEKQKDQEAKLFMKVQKAKEEEKIRKYREKKELEAKQKEEKDAKQREAAANSKAHHQQAHHHKEQQHQNQQSQQQKSKKDPSPKGQKHDDNAKKAAKPRGFFGSLFSLLYSCIWYLGLILITSATVAIALDCKGMGNTVPGNQPLCKDVSSLLSFNKPSATFGKNIRNSYSTVFTGYHNQAKPHLAPISKWISKKWSEFVKTDIGKQVEQVLYKIHAFIVDTWVKVQRFVVKQWNALQAWWKNDGKRQFGPALDGFVMGMKMVLNVVIDIATNIGALFVHFAGRVKTFFLAWSDGGFNAAMNTLNH